VTTLGNDYATATSLTFASLNSLMAANIALSDVIDNTSTKYLDILVHFTIADFAEAGNFLALFFATSSLDNVDYTTVDPANLGAMAALGHLPLIGAGAWRSRAFSLARAFGGSLPPYTKVAVYNDAGANFAGSGNSCQIIGVKRDLIP
jgi:hypothetical protein